MGRGGMAEGVVSVEGATGNHATAASNTAPWKHGSMHASRVQQSGSIEVYPRSVSFKDIDVDALYMLRINVKNVDGNAHRVKIVPPETSDFRLLYVPGAPLAPGLEVTAEIEFRAREVRDYHDCIRVESDDDSIEIPLHAFVPRPELELDSFVDFGMVALGASNVVDVELRNVGSRPANFKIEYDESLPLRISPRSGVLSERSLANSTRQVSIEYIGDDVGPFRAPAKVVVEGNEQPRMMDINANVMEQTVDFVLPDGGGIISTLDFGSIFCGQSKTVNALLVNNGPQLATFSLRTGLPSDGTPDGEGADDALAPHDEWERVEANRNSKEVMVVRPSNGVIQPFSKVEVEFTFQPPATPAPITGFTTTLAQESTDDVEQIMMNTKIVVKQTGQELSIPLKGSAVRLNVAASHNEFNFGAVPVNEHGDLMFSLRNENTELPVNFSFNRIANFRVRPSSGCLLPLQATDVYVTFAPSQLGEHQGVIMASVHGLKDIPVRVMGFAPSIGQKKRLIGGIDKTDVDFAPKLNFVELDENGQPINELSRFTTGDGAEAGPSSVAFLSRHDQVLEYSQSVEDVRRHFEHKQSWNQYLSNTRLVREQITIKRTKEEKPVDIGLVPGHGLKGPVPALPRDAIDEELWLKKPLDAPPQSPEVIFDENRLIKKKFKPAPKTAQEIHDCSTPLGAEDLHHIHTGPRVMNFGKVCVQSVTKKSFSLTNEMDRSILVALSYESDDLATNTPSQVVPPGATAGFDIVFQSNQVKNVEEIITYTINGAHSYRFIVKATVIPITLELAQNTLDFSFANDNLDPYVQEPIVISNPGNFPADFKWINKGTTFAVSPDHGTVEAGMSTEVTVTFRPQGAVKNEASPQEELLMNVDRGETKTLLCRSDVQEAKCTFVPKTVDMGVLSVATTKEKVIKVKNTGSSDTVFFFRQCPPGVLVSPATGKIARGGVVTCTLALYTVDAMVYDTPIVADIRCGKSIKFDFKADAQVAEIITEPNELEFGDVHIGTVGSCPLTIRNNSLFPATLLMGWPEDSEFTMEVREDTGEDMGDALVTKDAAGYKIQIDPGSGVAADVVFTPSEVQGHEFKLPLTLEGITMDIPSLPVLTASGLKPRLFLSEKSIDFGSKVVMKKEDLAKRLPYYIDVTLTNNDPQELDWQVDTGGMSAEEQSLFTVKPDRGSLGVGEACMIRVSFAPIEAVACSFSLPLRLDHNPNHEYLPIEVHATGCYPQLTFDRREIVLPTVPIGMVSRTSFYVINEGYDNLELRYKLPADTGRVPLKLEFPEKMLIGLSKERLLVEVSFMSKKPMSFTAKIDFLDADGNRFSVPVTGTTDNCLFTIYPFIGSNVKTHRLNEVEDGPVELVELGEDADTDSLQPLVLPISESDFNYLPFHIVDDKSANLMVRWLKATMTRCTFDSLPDSFVKSNGQLAFEVVEHLCGKKVAGRVGKLPNNKREAIGQLYAQYEELLNFLKAHGALLNAAKPEYFFSLDNFQRYQVLRSQEHSKKGVRAFGHDSAQIQAMETNWAQISRMMWTDLMCQVLKCFVLNRITPRSLGRLPGFDASVKPETAAFQSNVYSVPENVLLHWLTYHHNHIYSVNPKRITNFEGDMCDGAVVSAVILSHVPTFDQLKQLVLPPAHDEDFENNWAKITGALEQLGCELKLTAQDWRTPNPRDMLLFCIYLFQSLPQFVPKATIDFQGTLNESTSKTIELTNPSAKPVMYNVIVDGCQDFLVGESQVQLEPKSRRTLPVEYFARFSRPQAAKLMFISTRDETDPNANALAAAMVFTLEASKSVSKPSKLIEHTSTLYQPVAIDVDVENPFSSDCDLMIQLNQKQSPSVEAQTDNALLGPRGAAPGGKKKKGPAAVEYEALTSPEARKIKIKRQQKATISLTFLPVRLGTYRTEILFLDEKVGEFTYEIIATAEPPAELDTFTCQCDAKGSITKTFNVSVKNPMLDKIKARLPTADADSGSRQNKADTPPPVFQIEYMSNFLSGADSIQIGTGASSGAASRGGTSQGPVEPFTFSFHSRGAGTYKGLIMLRSDDPIKVYSDVRMYAVEITAIPETVTMDLEFETAARIAVNQDIPIVNRSDKPWKIQASLSGENFSGPREIVVDPGQTKNYTLTFSPAWMCAVQGQLVLVNTVTSERYQYTLRGTAEDPLAEGHLSVQCQARWRVIQQIPVKNTSSVDVTYAVVTDLAMFSGEDHITVPAKGEAEYALYVSTQQGGKFTGSITFTDEASEKYMWYTVEVNSTRPPPEQTLAVKSTVRQAVQVDINVENPLDEPVDFEVIHDGNGLLGEPLLMLAPKEVRVYQLIYSPLQEGETSGAVSFLNDKVGEFWYQLELSATRASPGSLDGLQCELGRQTTFTLPVENPTSNEITLTITSDNLRNFYADPASVVVPPYEAMAVPVWFNPSSMRTQQGAQVVMSTPGIDDWTFNCTGRGIPPTVMDEVVVSAAVGIPSTAVLDFRNPFLEALSVSVSLKTNERPKTFEVVLKKKDQTIVGPSLSMQIPYSFNPHQMMDCHAMIEIRAQAENHSLLWQYPVKGVAEAPRSGKSFKFACKARQRFEEIVEVVPNGIGELTETEYFTHEVLFSSDHEQLLERSLQIVPLQTEIRPGGLSGQALRFRLIFEPLRPVETSVELLLKKSSGGRWRYSVMLEAGEPDVDDTIDIEAPLGRGASVSFRLHNQLPGFAPFRAYFTPDSPPEFTVFPTEGVLQSPADHVGDGDGGTPFLITYAPREYGKQLIGRLVIITTEMQWTYEIRGQHPKYVAPQGMEPKVDSRLPVEMASQLGSRTAKRNYVKENLQTVGKRHVS